MDFEDAYRQYRREIDRLAYVQRLPGLDPEDIAQEMVITLWKATESYRAERGSFGAYWWSLWLNRRSDLAGSYFTIKRVHGIPTETLPEAMVWDQHQPLPPKGSTDQQRRIWEAVAAGDTPQEVRDGEGISKRRYYATVHGWRSEEVHESLEPDQP